MGPSRTARLYFLLVLDLVFFVLEITIGQSPFAIFPFRLLINPSHPGYAVGSLALVADSFHMLK
jgi:Co/Zn/Cd efflux system component